MREAVSIDFDGVRDDDVVDDGNIPSKYTSSVTISAGPMIANTIINVATTSSTLKKEISLSSVLSVIVMVLLCLLFYFCFCCCFVFFVGLTKVLSVFSLCSVQVLAYLTNATSNTNEEAQSYSRCNTPYVCPHDRRLRMLILRNMTKGSHRCCHRPPHFVL